MNRRAGLPWLLLAVATLLAPLAVAGRDFSALRGDPARHYADSPAPMLTSYDGYAFLRQACADQAPAVCRGGGHDASPSALALTIAATARLTGLDPALVAFSLPTLLALSLPLAVFAWGRIFYGRPAALGAALAAGASPYFLSVTALGQCDTDCLIPTLALAAGLALLHAFGRHGPARLRAAGLYALAVIAAFWWWRPGGYVTLLFLPLALFAHPPGKRPGVRLGVRLGLATAFLALVALAASGAYLALPAPVADVFSYAARHAALAFGLTPGTEAVSRSIIELRPQTLAALGKATSGSLPVFAASLLGVARLCALAPASAALLLPFACAGVLALHSVRMTLFFFPLAALGLGAALDWLLTRPWFRPRPGHWTQAPAALALAVCLLAPALVRDAAPPPPPPFDRDDDRLALAIGRDTPADTVLWSWWDDGYFLRYRANREVFFDGGSQSAEDCFVAAWPLAAADPDLAADWMRFFAAHGVGELGRLGGRFGSREGAVAYLLRLFSCPREALPAVLAGLPGPPLADARAYFFPDRPTCLVLRRDILSKSGFWLAYAAGPQARVPLAPANHVDVFSKEGLVVDVTAGRLVLPEAARAKGYGTVPTVWDVAAVVPDARELEGRAEPILFYGEGLPVAAIADRAAARSLAFRLLMVPECAPRRFARIAYTPGESGAWLVLPRPRP